MDFAYPPALAELQDRARGLADVIARYEQGVAAAPKGLEALHHLLR